ncbi:hypothetical protein [Anaerosporobacter sp.]|uniref:hypothetical protein n=1 Tax=Anaerosporobacter sp. TaxID=1872529 RepID=UPI00286EE550|nr:hypothetical protein [Anaerosporobacter sp.]
MAKEELYTPIREKNDVLNWLLEDGNPEVKYRTMTELLDMSKDESEVKKAYNSLLSSGTISLVMDKFKLGKEWDDVTALIALAEFGLTRNDISTDDYIERIIKSMNLKDMKCSKILLLRNLVLLGYYEHAWVKKQVFSSFSTMREDGTFRCLDKGKRTNDSKLPDMGCYRQTTTYLLLAAELKKIGVVFPEFQQLINFYINNHVVFQPNNPEKLIIEEMAGTYYPFDHVKLGLQMTMYGLSVLGAANHPNCNKAWALLESKKDSNGKYVLDKSHPYFKVGKIGESNKWITLYALLSEKYRML